MGSQVRFYTSNLTALNKIVVHNLNWMRMPRYCCPQCEIYIYMQNKQFDSVRRGMDWKFIGATVASHRSAVSLQTKQFVVLRENFQSDVINYAWLQINSTIT